MDKSQREALLNKIIAQFDEYFIDNQPYAEFLMAKIIRMESMVTKKVSFNQDQYLKRKIESYTPDRARREMDVEMRSKERLDLVRRDREKRLNEPFDGSLKQDIESIVITQLEEEARENLELPTVQDIMTVICSQGESKWKFTSKALLKGFVISTIKKELYGDYEGTDSLFVLDVGSLRIHESKDKLGGSFTLTLNGIEDCTLDYCSEDLKSWAQLFIDSNVAIPRDKNSINPQHVLVFGRALIVDFLSNTVIKRQNEYDGYTDDGLNSAVDAVTIENRLREICKSILFIHQGLSCSGMYRNGEQ